MGINPSSQMSLFTNGQQIETVRTFSYLGSIMDENGGTDSDVLSRINKSRAAFASLKPLRRSTVISLKTKIRLFNLSDRPVVWFRVLENLQGNTEMPQDHPSLKISNKSVRVKCNQEDIMGELPNRRWCWIGHVLRKTLNDKQALYCNPDADANKAGHV